MSPLAAVPSFFCFERHSIKPSLILFYFVLFCSVLFSSVLSFLTCHNLLRTCYTAPGGLENQRNSGPSNSTKAGKDSANGQGLLLCHPWLLSIFLSCPHEQTVKAFCRCMSERCERGRDHCSTHFSSPLSLPRFVPLMLPIQIPPDMCEDPPTHRETILSGHWPLSLSLCLP
jgi:hypothetical protein